VSKSGIEGLELLSFYGVFRVAVDCRDREWTNPVFNDDTCCLEMFLGIISMEMKFDTIFNNNCGPSMRSAVRMLSGIYCIVWDFNAAFLGEVCLGNQHNVHILSLYLGFDLHSMLGSPLAFHNTICSCIVI